MASNWPVAGVTAIQALAQSMGPAPALSQLPVKEVKPRTRAQFEQILNWLALFTAHSFDWEYDEAQSRLLSGNIKPWQGRWAWFAFGVKHSSSCLSQAIQVTHQEDSMEAISSAQHNSTSPLLANTIPASEAASALESTTAPAAAPETTNISSAAWSDSSSTPHAVWHDPALNAASSSVDSILCKPASSAAMTSLTAQMSTHAKLACTFHLQPKPTRLQPLDPHNENYLKAILLQTQMTIP